MVFETQKLELLVKKISRSNLMIAFFAVAFGLLIFFASINLFSNYGRPDSSRVVASVVARKSPTEWIKDEAIANVDALPDGRYLVLLVGEKEPYIVKPESDGWSLSDCFGRFLFVVNANGVIIR